jgi:hypothetical protein
VIFRLHFIAQTMANLTPTQTCDLTSPAKYGHMAFDMFLAVSIRFDGT